MSEWDTLHDLCIPQSSAVAAAISKPCQNFTPTTEQRTDAALDARSATKPDTKHGSELTGKSFSDTTISGIANQANDSGDTASQKRTLPESPNSKAGSAQSASERKRLQLEADYARYISTTTTRAGIFAGCCVLPATPESGNSEIIRIDLKLPPNTSVHADSLRFYQLLSEVAEIHARKQRDYGTPDAPFANLEASEDFGIPAWLGILVRMNDKISRLKTYAKTRKLANEGVIDNANDLAVYAIALRIAFEKAAK